MSNLRQDEVDAFFNAIDSPQHSSSSPSAPQTAGSPSSNVMSSPSKPLEPNHIGDQLGLQVQQQQPQLSPLFSATASATSAPTSSGSQSPRLQPGMSPAIQKGSVSLGLALGGSGFRRKPLFGPEDDDEDDGYGERKENLLGSGNREGKLRKMKKDKNHTATFQELTRSKYGDHGNGDGLDNGDKQEDEDEEEEDANSETPLHPQEQIRGLE
ncbi:hypothetical protein BC939DRAFT_477668 [Gamsiella multidivaricata]|uniref:uncharacterized protein n=1 Tax=Gamsiella multidivaricata TaxID=101098 RepID=UPI002220388B|nr:uncharacterized protein BC939DRAFT_477668 [Gamsiella multidivaricata]KAI7822716.1 hypothetical protein BC939DRAFT_477668 [Gamsiella multidivaricata]